MNQNQNILSLTKAYSRRMRVLDEEKAKGRAKLDALIAKDAAFRAAKVADAPKYAQYPPIIRKLVPKKKDPEKDAFDVTKASAFLKPTKQERVAARKAKKTTWGSYQRSAAIACRKLYGKTVSTPPTADIAASILAHQGLPDRTLTKDAAKQLIVEFAAGIPPIATSSNPPIPVPQREPAAKPESWLPVIGKPASRVDFYWSEEWRRVRYIALRASKGFCELCGAGPAPGAPLHVDHIKPRSRYPELELDPTNLQVLCKDCNLGKSNIDEIDWRRKQA